jgi:serine/threonine protein kinase
MSSLPHTPTIERSQLRAEREIDDGGEGIIYRVTCPDGRDRAFKRYHSHVLAKDGPMREGKLRAMIVNPANDPMAGVGHVSLLWPSHVVTEQGRFVGFLMPLLPPSTLKFASVRDPGTRSRNGLRWSWSGVIVVARNLASAVEALHQRDVLWGDLNEENALVTPQGLVTLCDLDTAAVIVNGQLLPGSGYTRPEWEAPELTGPGRFSKEADRWAVAVEIYALLMESFLPHTYRWTGSGEAPTYQANVRSGHAPVLDPQLQPPVGSPPIDTLSPQLRFLFQRAFGTGRNNPGKRPHAGEFRDALDSLAGSLRTCGTKPAHVYGRHRESCPWCEREAGKRRSTSTTSTASIPTTQIRIPVTSLLPPTPKTTTTTSPAPLPRPNPTPTSNTSTTRPTHPTAPTPAPVPVPRLAVRLRKEAPGAIGTFAIGVALILASAWPPDSIGAAFNQVVAFDKIWWFAGLLAALDVVRAAKLEPRGRRRGLSRAHLAIAVGALGLVALNAWLFDTWPHPTYDAAQGALLFLLIGHGLITLTRVTPRLHRNVGVAIGLGALGLIANRDSPFELIPERVGTDDHLVYGVIVDSGLNVRDLPNSTGMVVDQVAQNTTVALRCSIPGELVRNRVSDYTTDLWGQLEAPDTRYVSLAYVSVPEVLDGC